MKGSLDIASLRTFYKNGGSPAEIVRLVYERIGQGRDRAVWISLVAETEAQARLMRAPRGPLWGIPFAVKDNIDVAGLPTTCACPEFRHFPTRSAHVVERLEAAGAILIGKTNLDQFATGLVGTRSPYGIPRNVFNSEFISGGSSSGSAVAVAAGLVSFALGTDTAGSGRVPAAFNNIVGLKPSKGLISTRGVVPACRTQDCVSIFALTAADAQQILEVAEGYDADDAFSRTREERDRAPAPSQGIRIGIPNKPLEFCGDRDYADLYAKAIERCRGLGLKIIEIDFTPFREAASLLYGGAFVAERLAGLADFANQHRAAFHEVVGEIILGAGRLSAVEAFQSLYALAEFSRQARAQWSRMDVLLLPTAPTAYRVDEVLADPIRLNSNLGIYTNFVNLLDLSALAIPAGFRSDGIPFGVTLVAPLFAERQLLELGDRLHRAIGRVELGRTGTILDESVPRISSPAVASEHARRVQVAVVGAHLAGQPLHGQLTERGAKFVRAARTAVGYSLYALSGTIPAKPGLIFDGKGQGRIELEIYDMDAAAFGSFVAIIPAPLGIGRIELEDGTSVQGFLCESHAVATGRDITEFGGWRAWLATQHPPIEDASVCR